MNSHLRFISILVLSATAQIALAHDPAEHAKEAAAAKAGPDCAAMKDMDMSKMDPNDAVMKAMMAKCSAAKDHSGMDMPGMDHSKMGKPAGVAPDDHGSHY